MDTRRSILACFAHPDDETSIGPLLARYASEGHDVYLVSITSGQKGVAHNSLEPGDRLGAIREDELRCAARHLGIHEPIFFRFQDQGISSPAVMEKVAVRLRETIHRTTPDVVITFGAGGVTGHVDHIAAGEITTQVFEEQSLLEHKPRKLYYVVFPESLAKDVPDMLKRRRPPHFISDCFITTEVDCRQWVEAGHAAIECHKTQFPPDRVDQLREMHSRAFAGRVFLRLALACTRWPGGRETSILEGL